MLLPSEVHSWLVCNDSWLSGSKGVDVGVRIMEQRQYSSCIGSVTAWLIHQECCDGGDIPRVVSMGKYFIKETWNKKIKLKSKHECLTQCHIGLFLISFLIAPLVFIIISFWMMELVNIYEMKFCRWRFAVSIIWPLLRETRIVVCPCLRICHQPCVTCWHQDSVSAWSVWDRPGCSSVGSAAKTLSARVGRAFMSLFGEGASHGITGIKEITDWLGLTLKLISSHPTGTGRDIFH